MATALAHAVATTQINIGWLRRDEAFAYIDHQRAAFSDRNAGAHGDLLVGCFRVLDPPKNQCTTVQAGSNGYYRFNGTNTVTGTNMDLSAVDLTRMLRLD